MKNVPATLLLSLLLACTNAPNEAPTNGDGGQASRADGGPNAPSMGESYKSGTRLRAIKRRAAGGAESFLRWRDLDLSIDCTEQYANGEVRCLPAVRRNQIAVWFEDANCTVPFIRLYNTCGLSDSTLFLLDLEEQTGQECTTIDRDRYFVLDGDEMTPPAQAYRQYDIGLCALDNVDPGHADHYYPAREVDLTRYARLEEFVE